MTKIKLIALTIFGIMCFTMIQAQNDTLVKPTKAVDYDKLLNSNYKNTIPAKAVETNTVTEKETNTATEKETNFSGNWIIGAGINMVEDSGNQTFSDFFTLKNKNWGSPFMLSAEYLINNRFSFGANVLLNKYQAGKTIQLLTIQTGDEPNYFAVDFSAKLFIRKVLNDHMFTPYVTAGSGYRTIDGYQAKNLSGNLVDVPETQGITLNVGLGAYYWFDRNWGLNLSYIAKFAKDRC